MKLALIGSHPDSRLGAPYGDPSWTVWACSMANMHTTPHGLLEPDLPRWDAWFELHIPMGLHVTSGQVPEDYVAWLREAPRVYVRDPNASLPGAIRYPETEMRQRFGPFFFTSSIAHMMALAIAQQPTEIGLWGVGMHAQSEYEQQLPGCRYFIQRAWDAGIHVTAPSGSTLLDPPKDIW